MTKPLMLIAFMCAALVSVSCKDDPPVKVVLKRAPEISGPTSQEILSEKAQEMLKQLEPYPPLEGVGIVTETPDGEKWARFPNGIMIHDLKKTEGRKPQYGQMLEVAYTGTIPGTNKEFDKKTAGDPLRIIMGDKSFIKGFTIGLSTMSIGTRRRLFIPGDLAYGARGNPSANIGPDQALIFEIELLSITGESVDMPKVLSIDEMTQMGPTLPPPTQPATASATGPSNAPATAPATAPAATQPN